MMMPDRVVSCACHGGRGFVCMAVHIEDLFSLRGRAWPHLPVFPRASASCDRARAATPERVGGGKRKRKRTVDGCRNGLLQIRRGQRLQNGGLETTLRGDGMVPSWFTSARMCRMRGCL